jgi:hypothetical protein
MGSVVSCFAPVKALGSIYNAGVVARLFPEVNTVGSFAEYLRYAQLNDHVSSIYRKLVINDFVQDNSNLLSPSSIGFNAFASLAAGTHKSTVDQTFITNKTDWTLCHLDTSGDHRWAEQKFPWGVMAEADSIGPGHVCITTKSRFWKFFNITTIALTPTGLDFLRRLKEEAEAYTMKRGWVRSGYFLHCYPHSPVNSLCLHVINLDTVNRAFTRNHFRNLAISDAICVIDVFSAINQSMKGMLSRRNSIIFGNLRAGGTLRMS